jgi:protein-S-isoprenylcysteine O-methyltransferase Ste14
MRNFAGFPRVQPFTREGLFMHWLYDYFFLAVWIAFLLYWQLKSRDTKATHRLEAAGSRIVRSIVFLIVIALLSWPHIPLAWLYWHFLPPTPWAFFLGAAVTTAGLLFAVWARVHLGRNWSSSVTIKQDHQLIVAGPYAIARHPIYTGILTGFLGTAIATTQIRGLLAFVLVFLVLWFKLRMEEQWMRNQFGDTYAAYSKRVAALVPFIL